MNSATILNICDATGFEGCVLAYGHFSTIHSGHIRYLRHARNLGKRLLVALIGDGGSTVYPFNQRERAEALSLLGIADAVLLLKEDELDEVIAQLQPAVLVLGNEFKEDPSIQYILVKQRQQGRSVQFHADTHYATADLLTGSERDLRQQRRSLFHAPASRQGISHSLILDAINSWGETRLIVLGDTIVDQYAACEAIGMSAEAPVVVVRELERKNFIGGAAVVAAHIGALGAKCDFISVVGHDSTADLVRKELADQGIGDCLSSDPFPTYHFKSAT